MKTHCEATISFESMTFVQTRIPYMEGQALKNW